MNSIQEYIDALPEERRVPMEKLMETIQKNIPGGFEKTIQYKMIGFVVPHSIFPKGYHCDPKQPLPFVHIASQKNFIAVYHMGLYADKSLLNWFETRYRETVTGKLDMGKSCIRFKKLDQIPYDLMGELMQKMTVEDWVGIYEDTFRKK